MGFNIICAHINLKIREDVRPNAMDKVEDFRKVLYDLEDKVCLILKASQHILAKDIVSVKSYLIESSKESRKSLLKEMIQI